MKEKMLNEKNYRCVIVILVIIGIIGLFLPYEVAIGSYREKLTEHQNEAYLREIDLTCGDIVNVSIYENLKVYKYALSVDLDTKNNSMWLHGEAIIWMVITVALVVFLLLLLLATIFKKYVLVIIFDLLMVGSSLLMNYDISSRGVVPSNKYACGISYYLYIIIGAIIIIASVLRVAEKKKTGKESEEIQNQKEPEILKEEKREMEAKSQKEVRSEAKGISGRTSTIITVAILVFLFVGTAIFAFVYNSDNDSKKHIEDGTEKVEKDEDEDETTEETTVEETTIENSSTEVKETSGGSLISDYDNLDREKIIETAKNDVDECITELTEEWDTLKSGINSYDDYVKQSNAIKDFYKKIEEKNQNLCDIAYSSSLAYAKAVRDSGEDSNEKYDLIDDINSDIYNEMCDTIQDSIYDELMDEMKDKLYDGVLDDSSVADDYSEWSNTSSDEYSQWLETNSNVYSKILDTSSDIYSFYLELSSDFFSDDTEAVNKEITDFENKLK